MPEPNDCPLDELDIAILKRLTADGRTRFTEIAEELGVSHKTIRNRYARMQRRHSLSITNWLDPKRLGFHAGAQIRFTIETSLLEKAASKIAIYPEVTWMGMVVGGHNLMADVWCRNIQHLDDFVGRHLRGIPGVRHMEIALYSRIHKVATLPSLELLECAGTGTYPAEGSGARLPADRPAVGTQETALDRLDIAILEHLSVDGRKPFTEIAADLDVSHGTVRNRYNRMVENNVVKVMCWLDNATVGFRVAAHLDFSIEVPQLEGAAAQIATFPEVSWLAEVMGQSDLMADVFCIDTENLNDVISRRLGQIAGLRHMEVALYSQVRKITTMPNIELLNRAAQND